MVALESKRYHEGLLEADSEISEMDMSNTRINPTLRTISYWYDEWRKCNLGPRSGVGVIEVRVLINKWVLNLVNYLL